MNAKRSWIRVRTLTFIFAGSLFAGFLNAKHSGGTFSSIDFPGAIFTMAGAINSEGDIVGNYVDTGENLHGYLLSGGHFTSIDFPGAILTGALDINAVGTIVGLYRGSDGNAHGYSLSDGHFSTIDFPGAASTLATGINPEGEIVGQYCVTGFCGSRGGVAHGFIFRGGCSYTPFDPPDSIYTGGPRINPRGDVAGYFKSADGKTHVFLLSAGTFTTFDPPGPISSFDDASPGIDPHGRIVGYYSEEGPDGRAHAFVLSAGRFSTTDLPGAIQNCNFGISPRGDIVGVYQSADGMFHGFLRTRRR